MLDWLFGKKKQQPKPKPKKTQKQQQAEDKWMYDFMIQFLSSPIWRVSLLDFVDNKCIVFDNEEENKFQYTVIHNEFKQLVGSLVDGMMQQIGMSQQKLAEMIQRGLESKQKKLFNQLLLADDFLRFKDLMVKRNKHLQQQAINALHESQLRSSSKPQKLEKNNTQQRLLRESQILQKERQRRLQEEEQQMLRKAIQLSKISQKESQAIRQLQQKAVDKVQQQKPKQKRIDEQLKDKKVEQPVEPKKSKLQPLKPVSHPSKVSQLSDLPPLRGNLNKSPVNQDQFPNKVTQKNDQLKQEIKQAGKQSVVEQKVEQKPQGESMQDRKQRLLAQRQKIRKQKEQQRKKQLELQSQQKQKQAQPEVHTIVLQEDGFYDSSPAKKENVPTKQASGVSEDQLKRRRELMNKIKNRIIDDF